MSTLPDVRETFLEHFCGGRLVPGHRLRSLLRSLAAEERFSPIQPAPLLQAGMGYETDEPFAHIQVTREADIPDAKALFALLADHADLLAGRGKVTLVVGAEPLAGAIRERVGVDLDVVSRTITFRRDLKGRIMVMAASDPEKQMARALSVFRAI